MKYLIIVLALVMSACATSPETAYRAEMGWNSIMHIYHEMQRDCFQDGDTINGVFLPDQCQLSANDAVRANQIVKAYRYYAATFINSDDRKINACQMVSLAFKLGSLINDNIDPSDLSIFCDDDDININNMNLALKEAVEFNQ